MSTSYAPETAIWGWSIAGADRLVGTALSVDGQKDGRTIITSSVVRVRFEGNPPLPIAVTASGSEYWLGEPSEKIGPSAEQFVARRAALEVAADQVGGESVTRYAAPG